MSKKTATLIKIIATPIILSGVAIPLATVSTNKQNSLIEQTSAGHIANHNGEFLHNSDDSLEIHSSYYNDHYIKESYLLSDDSILVASYEEEDDDTPYEDGEYGPLTIYNQAKYNNNSHTGPETPLGFSQPYIFANSIDIKYIIPMEENNFTFIEEYNSLNSGILKVHYFDYNLVWNSINPLNQTNAWSTGTIQLPTGLMPSDEKEYEEIIYDGTNLIGTINYGTSPETHLVKLTNDGLGNWTIANSLEDNKIFLTVGIDAALTHSNQKILDIRKLLNGDTLVLQEEHSFSASEALSKKAITATVIESSYDFTGDLPTPTYILGVLPTDSMYHEQLSAEAAVISDDKVLIGINQGKVIEYNPINASGSLPEQVLWNSSPTGIGPTIQTMEGLSNGDVIVYGGNDHQATLNHYDSTLGTWTYKTNSYNWNEEVDNDLDSSILEIKELEAKDLVMISGVEEGYGLFNMKNNAFEKTLNSHDVLDGDKITHITEFTNPVNSQNDHYLVMGEEGHFNKLVFNDSHGIAKWSIPKLDSNLSLETTNSPDGIKSGSIKIVDGNYEDYFSIVESVKVAIDNNPATNVDSYNPRVSNTFSHQFSYSPIAKTGMFPGEYNVDVTLDYKTEKYDPNNTTKEVKKLTALIGVDDPNTPYQVSYDTNVFNDFDKKDDPIIKITNGDYLERGKGKVSKVEARVIDPNTAFSDPSKGWEKVDDVDITNKTFSHSFDKFDQNDSGYEVQIRLTYSDGTTRVEKTSNIKPTYISPHQAIFPEETLSTGMIIGIMIGSIIIIGLTIMAGHFFLKSGKKASPSKEPKNKQ